mmetsp:Transcript_2558/g.3748  ORF Transcript_2558/g.3748 Transcript_2558/m.3748 type:complete len:260 (+) Transcript_2558:47-826(+)
MIRSIVETLLCLGLFVSTAAAFVPPSVSKCSISTSLFANVEQQDDNNAAACDDKSHILAFSRRSFLGTAASLLAASTVLPAFAEGDKTASSSSSFKTYQNSNYGFSIKIPSNWDESEQNLPDRRRILLFVDPTSTEQDQTLAFIALNDVRDDFTALSSLGSLDQVGQAIVLPPGEIAKEDNKSEMLASESKKNAYFYDYVTSVPGQPDRHFRSIFALFVGGNGNAGGQLMTFSVQTTASQYEKMKPVFDTIIDSYAKTT